MLLWDWDRAAESTDDLRRSTGFISPTSSPKLLALGAAAGVSSLFDLPRIGRSSLLFELWV